MLRTGHVRRRPVVAVTVALAAALALSGCGSDAGAGDDSSADAASSLLPDAEGTTDYPLTLPTWAGESVIEERPERIAAIGFSTNLDVLEVLEVTPVYTQSEEAEWEWRDQDWLDSIETVDTATRRDPLNFEAIAASRPDLIVALNSVYEAGDFERLTEIAPVLEYEEQLGDQADWREGQQLVGEALDLASASEEAIDAADQAIADTAEAHPEFDGKTVTVATDYTTGVEYYTVAGGTAETFMTDLGFAPHPRAEDFVDDPAVSDESLAALDADALVVSYFDEETRRARESSPLFQSIPAVADGRYAAVVDGEPEPGSHATWVLRRGASALSLPWAANTVADVWLADVGLEG